jgi:hypothetical protein
MNKPPSAGSAAFGLGDVCLTNLGGGGETAASPRTPPRTARAGAWPGAGSGAHPSASTRSAPWPPGRKQPGGSTLVPGQPLRVHRRTPGPPAPQPTPAQTTRGNPRRGPDSGESPSGCGPGNWHPPHLLENAKRELISLGVWPGHADQVG